MVAKLTSSFLIQERKWRETELEKARSKARAEEEAVDMEELLGKEEEERSDLLQNVDLGLHEQCPPRIQVIIRGESVRDNVGR